MLLKEILATKGRAVLTIGPASSLMEALRKMAAHNCGSLVVYEDNRVVGMISERDILRTIADLGESLESISVEARMLTNVLSSLPTDNISDMMGLMTEHRVRHVPVFENGNLCGLISIGDLLKAQHDTLIMENHLLLTYIQS